MTAGQKIPSDTKSMNIEEDAEIRLQDIKKTLASYQTLRKRKVGHGGRGYS